MSSGSCYGCSHYGGSGICHAGEDPEENYGGCPMRDDDDDDDNDW